MPRLERQGELVAWEGRGATRGEPGPPCLLLHNLLADRTIWDEVAERLRPGRRLLLVDLRGHGESTARAPFDVAALAGDLVAVLDAEGVSGPVDVAGVSLGAAAAAELVRLAPARVGRLALLAANPRRSAGADALRNGALAQSVRWLGWTAPVVRAAVTTLLSPVFRAREPAVARGLAARISRLDPGAGARAVQAWIARPALPLDALRAQTLVVAGADDGVAPPALAQALASAVPGARVEVLPATGHTIPLERPAELAGLLAAHFRL